MVVLFHVSELLKLTPPTYLSFIPSHFGIGVPLFYSLSGFVLAYGYADRLQHRSEVLRFYVRRLFRIAPLFYFMLGVWILLGWVIWQQAYPWRTVFIDATFLFGLVPGEHESIVWAGWSVGVEALFYLVFPVFAVLIPNVRVALFIFFIVCILSDATRGAMQDAGLGSYAYMNLVTHLPNFVAGVASYRIWQATGFARGSWGWFLLAIALTIAWGLVAGPLDEVLLRKVSPFAPFYAWSVVFAFLILATCSTSIAPLERGPLRNLGQVSFSFYLLHPVILLALIKLDLVGRLDWLTTDAGVKFLVGSVLAVTLVWAASTVTFRWIEIPGIALGRSMEAFVKRAHAAEEVPAPEKAQVSAAKTAVASREGSLRIDAPAASTDA
jgi:peptidoglycan/LPS O-acetylase OafA/YrhL